MKVILLLFIAGVPICRTESEKYLGYLHKSMKHTERENLKSDLKVDRVKRQSPNDPNRQQRINYSMTRHRPIPRPPTIAEETQFSALLSSGSQRQLNVMARQMTQKWTAKRGIATVCSCVGPFCDCCASLPQTGAGCLSIEANLSDRVVDLSIYRQNSNVPLKTTTIYETGGYEVCQEVIRNRVGVCLKPLYSQLTQDGGIHACFAIKLLHVSKKLCTDYRPGANAYIFPSQ